MEKLSIRGIQKNFGNKEVLKGCDFDFEQGKIYGLLGRNGAGKTTLFNCISGELRADAGEMVLSNQKEVNYDDIGFVYATPILPEFLTGYEFIKFFIDVNRDKIENPMSPMEYLKIVRINEEDAGRLINGYSHGMKNKLQMLSYIITKPKILLLDEPLTSFDVVTSHEMKELLLEMKKNHIIIFSTHILQLATDICDEIAILNNGTLSGVGAEEIRKPDFENKIIQILGDEENEK